MEDYKYLPLEGLFSLTTKSNSNADIFDAINKAEKIINSSPSGRVEKLALLFYVIKTLKNAKLDFYVKGGIIQHYYLKDKTRPTEDLDIITPLSADQFCQQLKTAFETIKGDISINIVKCNNKSADDKYYYDTLNIELEIFHQDQKWLTLYIDGISNSFICNKIKPKSYKIPDIISPNSSFLGVPIEYVLAEKIIAITNELKRPYKHLIDVYSIIHTDVDVSLLKNYLSIIIESDNVVRKKLNKEINTYTYQINEHKDFASSYLFPTLQAGYLLSFNEMKEEVNKWLDTNLNNDKD